jgi:DNA-binding beta-propeller fold protein YncE
MYSIPRILFLAAVWILLLQGCKPDPVEPETYGFPTDVADIILTRCATPGCHNDISYGNAGGINLSSWSAAFGFGRAGSSIIPYSTDYSYLLYFVNTDSTRGPALQPTMPLDQAALSVSEYEALKNWIRRGAPDKDGRLRYPADPSRKKLYACMQSCDQVAVIDAASNNIMRYIPVGSSPMATEGPHQVKVSPDGQYWYVVFFAGTVVQKFRTSDDSIVSQTFIGPGQWNTLIISPDGRKGFVNGTDLGTTVEINLETMAPGLQHSFNSSPHGGFITPDGRWLYLTQQTGSFITKVDLTTYDTEQLLLGGTPGQDSHEMTLSPDGTRYFVSCQATGQVLAYQLSNDSLLAVINVGAKPQEFAVSTHQPYVYVTCTEEPVDASRKGLVYVIDAVNLTVSGTVYTGFQPHGIAYDSDRQLVYVAHLNLDQSGPAPHHFSMCGGRNGYITCIDERTGGLLQKSLPNGAVFNYRQEVLPAPYFISYKR